MSSISSIKKISVSVFASLLLTAALTSVFTGCSKNKAAAENSKDSVKVIATIFPIYDWAKNVTDGAENISLELLVKNGVDLHSFQPSAQDMVKIGTCDVLIYAGGESDGWVKDALKNAANKNIKVISLMELLRDQIKEEEIIEGMQEEAEEENTPSEAEKTSIHGNSVENKKIEYDEHIWLSLVNAKLSCQEIASVLSKLDSSEAGVFDSNLASYLQKIDSVWASCVTRDRKVIVVCDRFPFRYMADELGILYFAAFPGCSAETEASFETVAFLSEKIRALGLKKVFVTENSDKKLARTVISNAGIKESEAEILVLDSMQSTTLAQAENGANYIDIMKKNFTRIAEANKAD